MAGNGFLLALRNFVLAVCYAYAMSISGFLGLWLVGGETFPILAWLTNILHLLLLPLPLIVILVFLLRYRKRSALLPAALMAPALVIGLLIYAPALLPKASAAPPDAPRLRMVTFNLARATTPELVEIALDTAADVIALQELVPGAAAQFEAILAEEYPYRAIHPQASYAGLAILSRYPITSDEYRAIGHGQQRVTLAVNGVEVVIFNVHTFPPFSIAGQLSRSAHVQAALDWSAGETGAVIVLGDFNMTPLTADYRAVTARYSDAFAAAGQGFGFTYPSWAMQGSIRGLFPPLARIDYVFTSPALMAVHAEVWSQSHIADHRPLVVELAIVMRA